MRFSKKLLFKDLFIATIYGEIVMNVNDALASRIKYLLKENKITQYRLTMNSGITHSTLKNIMHGTVNDNLLSTVILIAGGFDMTVSEFLNDKLFLEENLNIKR